jgi:hypothetical protein
MFRTTCLTLVLLAASPALFADPPPRSAGDDLRKRVDGYLDQALPGVFYSDHEDVRDGRIVRLFAVGTAIVHDTLGREEGLDQARRRAQEAARAELARFLATRVTVKVTASDEVVLARDGSDGAVKETGRKVERRTREFEERATAVIRGLRMAGARQVAEEKRYVVVYRWDVAGVAGATELKDRMEGQPGGRLPVPSQPLVEKRVVVRD